MGSSTFHFPVNLRVYVFQNILFACVSKAHSRLQQNVIFSRFLPLHFGLENI